jgi:hypothetical protein
MQKSNDFFCLFTSLPLVIPIKIHINVNNAAKNFIFSMRNNSKKKRPAISFCLFFLIVQLILPGQFINTAESPSPSFLSDLQTMMTGRPPPPARHNAAPSTLPEELLLARFVLVRRDGAQPPLSPIYDGPYQVLERSTHFFLLEMGDRTDKVSTLRLKAAQTSADTEPAKPPRRGHPVAQVPPVRAPPRNSGGGRVR